MSKALVIGGASFIGSNLAALLLDEDRHVVIYGNHTSGYHQNVTSLPRTRFIEGDVRDVERSEPMQGADAIFHLAALSETLDQSSTPIASSDPRVSPG